MITITGSGCRLEKVLTDYNQCLKNTDTLTDYSQCLGLQVMFTDRTAVDVQILLLSSIKAYLVVPAVKTKLIGQHLFEKVQPVD